MGTRSGKEVGVFFVIVVLGCALGGVCRYLGGRLVARWVGERFPWGTLVVNAIGTFCLGLTLGSGFEPGDDWLSLDGIHAFLAIGFCGGLTTFSTFSLQTVSLITESSLQKALGNMLFSVFLCVFCAVSGYAIGEGLVL